MDGVPGCLTGRGASEPFRAKCNVERFGPRLDPPGGVLLTGWGVGCLLLAAEHNAPFSSWSASQNAASHRFPSPSTNKSLRLRARSWRGQKNTEKKREFQISLVFFNFLFLATSFVEYHFTLMSPVQPWKACRPDQPQPPSAGNTLDTSTGGTASTARSSSPRMEDGQTKARRQVTASSGCAADRVRLQCTPKSL